MHHEYIYYALMCVAVTEQTRKRPIHLQQQKGSAAWRRPICKLYDLHANEFGLAPIAGSWTLQAFDCVGRFDS